MAAEPLKILIVERDRKLCDSLGEFLGAFGHQVACVSSGREGLEEVRSRRPDLLILDLDLPADGGTGMFQRLQRGRETRHIPVIALSRRAELEDEVGQVFDFIPKPLDLARLRETIDLVIERRGAPVPGMKSEHLCGEEYRSFYDFLVDATGLHFDERNLKTLERGLLARMAALKIGSFADYFSYLSQYRESRGELGKLLHHLTIGETYFFRYPYHFDALRQRIIPELVTLAHRQGNRRLRIWSAGCSTGEEPYSLAMAFMSAIPAWREWDIRIIATDINSRSLRRARLGTYGSRAFRTTDRSFLDRYFIPAGDGFAVKEEVKQLVDFSLLNLQADDFSLLLDDGGKFDVIFCRNVMIYFNLPTVRRIVEKLTDCLKPEGYFFLGHSESLHHISTMFERHAHGGGFFYSKRNAGTARLLPPTFPGREIEVSPQPEAVPAPRLPSPEPSPLPLPVLERTSLTDAEVDELYAAARLHFDAEAFSAADPLLDRILSHQSDHRGALLIRGLILANGGAFAEALLICDRLLALDDLAVDAYLLRGLVMEADGDDDAAVSAYRTAILLDMESVIAHYHLGRLYLRLGKGREGTRELRNTLKLLNKMAAGEIIPFSGGVSCEGLMGMLSAELGAED